LKPDDITHTPQGFPRGMRIPISHQQPVPTVSARALHQALQVATRYHDWFARMRGHGFVEGKDFFTTTRNTTSGRPCTDHAITITMAKELCLLLRSPAGREFRRYFLECEQDWESPDRLIQRAFAIARARRVDADRQIFSECRLPQELLALVEDREPHGSFDHTGEDFLKETL